MRPLAVGLLLLALVPVPFFASVTEQAWVDDEGLYAMAAQTVMEGSWDWPYEGASFDPEGQWLPLQRADAVEGRFYPYARHPVWVLLLAGVAQVFGVGIGFYALPVVGFVIASLFAWTLAAELEPRAGPFAFALVAGSPLFANAYILWAHAPSAAASAAATWAVARIVRRGMSPVAVATLVLSLGIGLLLRSEGLLFAVAITVALAGAMVTRARADRSRAAMVLPAAVVGVGTALILGLVAIESLVVRAITRPTQGGLTSAAGVRPRATAGESVVEFVGSRWSAAWKTTLSGSNLDPGSSTPILLAGLTILGVALLWPRIRRSSSGPTVVLGAGAVVGALYVWRVRSYPEESVHGLVAAWPAVIGLVLFPFRSASRAEGTVLAALVMFALGVYATQYSEGGGAEWGGRFLSPLVPGLAALVAVGVVRRLVWRPRDRALRRASVAFALVVLLAPVLTFVWMRREVSLAGRSFLRDVEAVATRTVVLDSATQDHRHFALFAWRLNASHDFFVTRPADASELLDSLHRAGFDDVTVVHAASDGIAGQTRYASVADVTPPATRKLGGAIHVLRRGAEASNGVRPGRNP